MSAVNSSSLTSQLQEHDDEGPIKLNENAFTRGDDRMAKSLVYWLFQKHNIPCNIVWKAGGNIEQSRYDAVILAVPNKHPEITVEVKVSRYCANQQKYCQVAWNNIKRYRDKLFILISIPMSESIPYGDFRRRVTEKAKMDLTDIENRWIFDAATVSLQKLLDSSIFFVFPNSVLIEKYLEKKEDISISISANCKEPFVSHKYWARDLTKEVWDSAISKIDFNVSEPKYVAKLATSTKDKRKRMSEMDKELSEKDAQIAALTRENTILSECILRLKKELKEKDEGNNGDNQ